MVLDDWVAKGLIVKLGFMVFSVSKQYPYLY